MKTYENFANLYLSKTLEQLKIVTLKLLGDSLVTAESNKKDAWLMVFVAVVSVSCKSTLKILLSCSFRLYRLVESCCGPQTGGLTHA